ncbi:MAG: RagB/SusD family nutrient uptake outer membrane protein [Prolixibacteraceae bacterium]|nr:RagB/SusD family nutrient uptake outer membrane protein [Prolixibacteraceae bacterium]
MKKRNIFLMIIAFWVNVISFSSCNEDELLKEIPKDFYSPENSYITNNQFQMAVNNLYYDMRYLLWGISDDSKYAFYYATDFAYNATNYLPGQLGKLNDYTNVMIPSDGTVVLPMWTALYSMVKDANVIIDRLESPDCQVTEANKKNFRAESMFFRAFAYRTLAHLWGGVPIVLHEITTPNRELVRATRDDVYKQCASDLEYGVANLPAIDKVKDGKVSSQVCSHLLSEIYISLKDYDKAILAASSVINYSGLGLMTTRFGSKKSLPGDVYTDLFRYNNQNRSSGNKEALFVIQYDYLNAGSTLSANLNRFFVPFYQSLSLGGKTLFAGVADGKCGRGIGWVRPTNFFFYQNWGTDFNKDIRNSQYNIIRDCQIDNPSSPHFGKWMVKDGINKMAGIDTIRNWYPIITKVARVSDSPSDIYQKAADGTPIKTVYGDILLTNQAANTFKDEYLFRLAETYLLRAEAYIGKGNTTEAAVDINVIRNRAGATPISAGQATIDFVLDERLRELYCEELRMVTLCRLGKLVERNRKYNPHTGLTISNHHNLWPLPYSEIARNIFGVIEQNPGYSN